MLQVTMIFTFYHTLHNSLLSSKTQIINAQITSAVFVYVFLINSHRMLFLWSCIHGKHSPLWWVFFCLFWVFLLFAFSFFLLFSFKSISKVGITIKKKIYQLYHQTQRKHLNTQYRSLMPILFFTLILGSPTTSNRTNIWLIPV